MEFSTLGYMLLLITNPMPQQGDAMQRIAVYLSILFTGLLILASSSFAATDGSYTLLQAQTAWDGTSANRQIAQSAAYSYSYGDEGSITYQLPWAFTFYGQSYNQITADTNGNIWFSGTGSAHSYNLTSTGRGSIIAAWNNDLSSAYYGGVFIQHKSSPERIVVEWQTETYTDEGSYRPNRFEAVLFQNGSIRLDYATLAPSTSKDYGSGISKGDGTAFISLTSAFGSPYTLSGRSFGIGAVSTNPVTVEPPATVSGSCSTLSGSMQVGSSIAVTTSPAATTGTVSYPTPTSWSVQICDIPVGDTSVTITATSASGQVVTTTATLVRQAGSETPVPALGPLGIFAAMAGIMLLLRKKTGLLIRSLLLIMFLATPADLHAALSCNTQGYASVIGTELVAVQCIPDNMNNSTAIYYRYRDYECIGGVVTKTAEGNTILSTPNSIQYPSNGMGNYFRHFRNREGSYFLEVSTWYRGTIEGKSMSLSAYPGGGVYPDIFTQIIDMTSLPSTPDCQGGDFNNSNNERCVGSTVNLGTGRLSHSQELFALGSHPLALALSLQYLSTPFAPSSIGNGWSHTYEMSLQLATNSATFWHEGKRRIFTLYNGSYQAPQGDYGTLVKNTDNSYTLTEKDGLKRNFDTAGKLVSLVDRNNNTVALQYTSGKLTMVSDHTGRSITLTYNADNTLAGIADPKGNSYTFTYSGGKLTGVTNPDNNSWNYSYGSNGLLSAKTDPEGHQTSYGYDTNNRLTTATDPEGRTGSYAFPAMVSAGKIPDPYPVATLPQKQFVVTEKDGGNQTSVYDTRTETVKTSTDPLGNVTSYTYDSQGNILTRTEPGIGTTTYTYDTKGNVLTLKDPLDQTTIFSYNSFSQILTRTAPGGAVTAYSYDTGGNLLTITAPDGAIIRYSYDSKGNILTITDPKGAVTTLGYDTASNLTSITRPDSAVTSFTHDANGNILTSTDPLGKVTSYSYDSRNRLVTSTDPLGNVTTYSYDANGNLQGITDANGQSTSYQHTYQGLPLQVTNTLNAVTRYGYGSSGPGAGQLTSLTDGADHSTQWGYDLLGRVISETDPLNNTTTYSYGATPLPVSRTSANGQTVSYSYDALQRLISKTYPDNSNVSYSYDSHNNILTAFSPAISYTLIYDAADRLIGMSDTQGNSLSYQYDANGNRTSLTVQTNSGDSRSFSYTYDSANRPLGITSTLGSFSFSYDANGRRTTLNYPNQITAQAGYDNAGRLTSLSHGSLITHSYSHDAVGNRTSKNSDQYLYDLIYRLISNSGITTETFNYDTVGNRTLGPGLHDTSYSYDAANRMQSGRTVDYGYDANSNQTARIVPNATDKTWIQTFDAENRLIKVEKTKGTETKTVTFTYDPFGRRIAKQVNSSIDGITSSATWQYLYDGPNIILEQYTSPTGTIEKTWYTHTRFIDEPLGMERNSQSYFLHADGLGSITHITDQNRNLVQSYSYDSFGHQTPTTGFRNSITYTGREWDKETGLYYYRARYYDPLEGRFISKDPIGFAGGDVNLFGYVGSNPLNWVDPSGLMAPALAVPLYYGGAKVIALGTAWLGLKAATTAMKNSGTATKKQACEAQNAGNRAIQTAAAINIIGAPLAMGSGLATYYGPSMYTAGMVAAGMPGGQKWLEFAYDAISGAYNPPSYPRSFYEAIPQLNSIYGDWKTYNGK